MIEYTVKELAWLDDVGERTVRRWIAKGAVRFRKTPGGGIRILCAERHPRDRRLVGRLAEEEPEPGQPVTSADSTGHLAR